MMASAKIVRRRSCRRINKSKIIRTDSCNCWKRLSSTRALMPGVGICAAMRYTASSARVNNTLFRKSGMRKRFRNASMNRFILLPLTEGIRRLALALASWLTPQKRQQACRTPDKSPYNLEGAAALGDLFLPGRAERVRVNGNLSCEFALAKNLYALALAANESVRAQQLRRHCFAGGKDVQLFQVQDPIFDSERVMKRAPGHAAMQRHLAAFKSTAARITAAGLLSLVAGAGSLAELRAHAAANTHLAVTRADRRTQIRQARSTPRDPSGLARRVAAGPCFFCPHSGRCKIFLSF